MRKLQLVLDLHRVLGVVYLYVYASVCLCAPFVFEIEVDRFRFGLLLASACVLVGYLLLDPGLESDVELPSSLLEL